MNGFYSIVDQELGVKRWTQQNGRLEFQISDSSYLTIDINAANIHVYSKSIKKKKLKNLRKKIKEFYIECFGL